MYIHDQTEQAYKNGYEAGKKEAQAEIEKKDIEIDILIRKKDAAYDEIARLQGDNVKLHTIIPKMIEEAKSEAIKDFAKYIIDKSSNGIIYAMDIPDYVVEMREQNVKI